MPEQIRDGAGQGYLVKVDSNQRLHTQAVTETVIEHANKEGDAYNINTGEITLTNATETPVLYFKNNEVNDVIVSAVAVGIAPSTGGSGGIPKVTIVRNPTAGTIIDNATAVDINQNRNFGSSKTLAANVYKGATGNTLTGGNDVLILYQTTNGRLFATVDLVVPKGQTLGIKIAPQSGNTSMTVYAALICHINDPAGND